MKLRHALTAVALLAGTLLCVGQSTLPKWKMKALQQQAKVGDTYAMWQLGDSTANQKKAKEWYHKASDAGFVNPLLEQRVGDVYVNTKNPVEAQFWLKLAESHGNAAAAADLSRLYAEGTVLPKNDHEAAEQLVVYRQLAPAWGKKWPNLAAQDERNQAALRDEVNNEESARAQRKQDRLNMLNAVLGAVNDALTPPPQSTPQYPDPSPSVSSTSTEASAQPVQDQPASTSENSSVASNEPETSTSQPGAVEQPNGSNGNGANTVSSQNPYAVTPYGASQPSPQTISPYGVNQQSLPSGANSPYSIRPTPSTSSNGSKDSNTSTRSSTSQTACSSIPAGSPRPSGCCRPHEACF